jgi:hypothetical protein
MTVEQVHSYTPGNGADATIDGQRCFVPEDPSNRHWQQLLEWEAAPDNSWPIPPAPTLAELKRSKLDELAAIRWASETGGLDVAEFTVKTDENSTAKLTAAAVKAEKDPTFTVRWKVAPGVFVELDAPTIIVISDAVLTHVQERFDLEAELSEQIMAAASKTALAAIDITAGW